MHACLGTSPRDPVQPGQTSISPGSRLAAAPSPIQLQPQTSITNTTATTDIDHQHNCNHRHQSLSKQASSGVCLHSCGCLLLLLLIVTRFVSQPPLLSRCTCQHDAEPSGKMRHASMTESHFVVTYGHQTCYPANAAASFLHTKASTVTSQTSVSEAY